MSIVSIILIVSLFLFFLLAVPVAFSIGIAALLALVVSGMVPLSVIPQKMVSAVDSFPLLAIPFFILAGEIMLRGGISKRLIDFAASLFDWFRGGLTFVGLAASAFFGAISGSALATTAAIGSIMHPEMVKRGYKSDFSTSLQAVGGTLGILIPPSIPLIVYGVLTSASIGDLFIAVIGAGALSTIAFMITSAIIVHKEGMALSEQKAKKGIDIGEVWKSFKSALWGLVTPVLILGGIYGGIFTPTESAIIACIYVLFVSIFIYKDLKVSELVDVFVNSTKSTAEIMIIVSTASLLGYVMTIERIPQNVASFMLSISNGEITFLLLTILVFLIAGMFMETTSIILLLVPLFGPVAFQLGIDPVHFGVITVLTLSLGLITPPFGTSLFVAVGITKDPLEKVYRRVVPFIIAGIIVILIVAFMPAITIGLL